MTDINHIRSNITNYYKKKKEDHYKEHCKRRNEMWLKYYGSTQWKELRNKYYQQHCLCECCLRQGRVVQADEVHHIHKFSSGITEEAKWRLLLNENNLISLCAYHHDIAHKYMNNNHTDIADIDDILYYEEHINSIIR